MSACARRPTAAQQLALELLLPPRSGDLDGVTLHLVVEEVAVADALDPPLFRSSIEGLALPREQSILALTVDLPALAATDPALRCHLARAGGDTIRVGDFINPVECRLAVVGGGPCRLSLIEVR